MNYLIVNKSGRTHGLTITVSSQGLSGRHSVSDISTTPAPVDPVGLGSSIQPPPILSRVSSCFPYSSQHVDYYWSSGHMPSYILGLEGVGGDEDGEETVQDEWEHVEGEGEEDVDMGGRGMITEVHPPSYMCKLGRGEWVGFLRDTTRFVMGFARQS
ncbi:hypothetical protein M9H77_08182 [Catharanthus roseus]|uniref:Uncharacterized protein n=1 Tax=Catharanthus roseus TaxID=4058 RepID=A0ACC0BXA8_CATRO|nr:hypothetical protein M9H77_08182 [Catharanthus roseus]